MSNKKSMSSPKIIKVSKELKENINKSWNEDKENINNWMK